MNNCGTFTDRLEGATAKETFDGVEKVEGEGGSLYRMFSRSVQSGSGDARAFGCMAGRVPREILGVKTVPWALSAAFPPIVFGWISDKRHML